MKEAGLLIFSYLVGSIPIGLIVGKVACGVDIRKFGSGNIGAANVLRTLGKGPAAAVFAGDTLKGLLPVLAARTLATGAHAPYLVIAAGMLAIVGHGASVFLGFRGGKGVATSLGVIIGLNWLIAVIAVGIWVLIVAATRYVSAASIAAGFSVPMMMHFSRQLFGAPVAREYTILALAAALLIMAKHRSNIRRLLKGAEPKFGERVRLEGDVEHGPNEPPRQPGS